MSELNYKKIIDRYNNIMFTICREHLTIGTRFSEGTENWNIRDLVAECDYQLSCYYEIGHCNNDMKNEDRKCWISETGKLKRFINSYKYYINNIKCTCNHCSKYDNK